MTPPGRQAVAQAGLALLLAYASARSLAGGSVPWALAFLGGHLIACRAVLRFHALARLWRIHAREMEQQARPPGVINPYAAVVDELQARRAATRHACCRGSWTAGALYRHHPKCPQESR